MKPETADDAVVLGKGVKGMADEVVNGEYGLVINGHSLVRPVESEPPSSWL